MEEPRHIEFQILADHHGRVIHLGERECSIQRRHQKIIEEAPSVVLDDELRRMMGQAAIRAAQACRYRNAGTIEFMLDKHRHFYFLEMNTRLQVEHPVTEMVTGLDLVREQIRIAAGLPMSVEHSVETFWGHAIECRLYAEDAENNFAPSPGTIQFLKVADGPGIREDSGVNQGSEISLYYDPMISKLIAWGSNRRQAIERMVRALNEYQLSGIKTNLTFLKRILQHPDFKSGRLSTTFIEKHRETLFAGQNEVPEAAAILALLTYLSKQNKRSALKDNNHHQPVSQWKMIGRMKQMRRQ